MIFSKLPISRVRRETDGIAQGAHMTKIIKNNFKSSSMLVEHLVQARLSARLTGHEDKETQFLLLRDNQITDKS